MQTSAVVVLDPPVSKSLIAKAVVALPEVRSALEDHLLIVTNGTGNSYIASELLGRPVDPVGFAAGIITDATLAANPKERRIKPLILEAGEPAELDFDEALRRFTSRDVLIKGANAIDHNGDVGVLMAHSSGGTIGSALPILSARGSHLICPVGLEKLIPSVKRAAAMCGQQRFEIATGLKVGMMCVSSATVITEVEAFELLCSVEAVHLASGGIGESQGAVTIGLYGEPDNVKRGFDLIEEIKG
jgi:hypothetical protein